MPDTEYTSYEDLIAMEDAWLDRLANEDLSEQPATFTFNTKEIAHV